MEYSMRQFLDELLDEFLEEISGGILGGIVAKIHGGISGGISLKILRIFPGRIAVEGELFEKQLLKYLDKFMKGSLKE